MTALCHSKVKIPSLELTYLQNGKIQFWILSFINIILIFALGFISKSLVSVAGERLTPPDYSYLFMVVYPCFWQVNVLISKLNFSFKVTLPKVVEFNSFCRQLDVDTEYALSKIRQMGLNVFISQSPIPPDNQDNVLVRNVFLFHRQNVFHNPSFIEKVRYNQVCLDYRQALPLIEENEERYKQQEAAIARRYQDEICLLKKSMADSDHKINNLELKLNEANRTINQLIDGNDVMHEIKKDIVEISESLDKAIKAERKSTETQNANQVLNAVIVGSLCMSTIKDVLMNSSGGTILHHDDLHKMFLSGIKRDDFAYKLCQKYMPTKMTEYDKYLKKCQDAEKKGILEDQIKYGILKEPALLPKPIREALWKIATDWNIAAKPGHKKPFKPKNGNNI